MIELKFCYTCENWHTTRVWRGNCREHPWEKDKYSQDARVSDCRDYVDKSAKYQRGLNEREDSRVTKRI